MLSRSSRLRVKPNILKANKIESKQAEKSVNSLSSTEKRSESNTAVQENSSSDSHQAQLIEETPEDSVISVFQPAISDHVSCVTVDPASSQGETSSFIKPHTPQKRGKPVCSEVCDSNTSFKDCIGRRLDRTRKRFTGNEKLDTKKMRMIDLVYWNPKNEKAMTRRRTENESIIGENRSITSETHRTVNRVAAPQVKITPDGRIEIDEDSLVVSETAVSDNVWETIDENLKPLDRYSRKVTSLSFRNQLWRKGTAWTKKETELFYEIVRCTGPDFGLMHEFFPSRARNELKSKFNREERTNWIKLKEVLSKPALLDEELYERVAEIQKEIEEEALAKKTKKTKDMDIKITYKRRSRKGKGTAVDVEKRFGSVDVTMEHSTITTEVEDESNTSCNLTEDHSVSDHSTSQMQTSFQERGNRMKAKELSARAQELLSRTVNRMKSEVPQQNEKITEIVPEVEEFEGYDDEIYNPINNETSCTHDSTELPQHEDHTGQATNNISSNVEIEARTQFDSQGETVEDNFDNNISQRDSREVELDSNKNVASTRNEIIPLDRIKVNSSDIVDKPLLLSRPPRIRHKLRLQSNTTKKLVDNSERNVEGLHDDSEISGARSEFVNSSHESESCSGSKMLTRSSRLRKIPRIPSLSKR
ncbi:Myb-like DNA-binding domain protein [Dictyocaulus viviparus]|uniref:Myb-like DNA-binding domain protein n=1 Tax=Dictyocaulus viviparus TaxID=29172 RepID=A0A0D8XYJ2_DICVI|nr:Myb-like DNA-binding domain protein [Dictyocaulus viviparus]